MLTQSNTSIRQIYIELHTHLRLSICIITFSVINHSRWNSKTNIRPQPYFCSVHLSFVVLQTVEKSMASKLKYKCVNRRLVFNSVHISRPVPQLLFGTTLHILPGFPKDAIFLIRMCNKFRFWFHVSHK